MTYHVDRVQWKLRLAEAPPRDRRVADELAQMVVAWAEEQLRKWFANKPAQDLEEIASLFVTYLCRVQFACLAGVQPQSREAYLSRILKHVAVKFYEKDRRRTVREVFYADITVCDHAGDRTLDPDDLAGRAEDPEAAVVRRAEMDEILAVVATMNAMNRRIFQHYFLEEKREREVAALLGLPVGTVSQCIHKIRVALRKYVIEGVSGTGVAKSSSSPAAHDAEASAIPRQVSNHLDYKKKQDKTASGEVRDSVRRSPLNEMRVNQPTQLRPRAAGP